MKQTLIDPPRHKSNTSSIRRLRVATILLVVSFAVLVIVGGTYNVMHQYSVVTDTTTRTGRNTLKTVETHATQTFNEIYRIMEGIADVYRHELNGAKNSVVDELYLHNLMAGKLKLAPAALSFFIVDANFVRVAGSRTYPALLARSAIPGMVFEAMSDVGGNLMVGNLFRDASPGPLQNYWILPMTVKVNDEWGRLRGYVFAMLRTGYFSEYYATLDIGTHGQIALWTDNNQFVAGTEATQGGDGRAVDAMWNAGTNAQTQNIMLTGRIHNMPLSMGVMLDARDFLSAWRDARNTIGLAIIAVILAKIVFVVIILRQLKRTEENERALRQAKAAAEEANDAKSRFLAHMSHEFRTPLNAIMGFSEIIKNKLLGDSIAPAYISYANHIHRSGQHLLNIVNDILDMAKVESGVQPLVQEAIDIPHMIHAAVSFIEGMANQQHVSIRVTIPPQLPMVSGDQRFCRQVLINLLSNAIKFSPAGRDIIMAARYVDRNFLDIYVTDLGPGIEPALLKRLGEPFLQGNPSVSHSGQGTGLGLSICKRYMDLLGGELIIDSTLGTGTTAIIRFAQQLLITPETPATERSVA